MGKNEKKKRKPAALTAKKRTRKFVFISTAADIFLSVFFCFFYFPIFINKAFGFCLGQSSSEVEKNILLFLSSLCSSLNKQTKNENFAKTKSFFFGNFYFALWPHSSIFTFFFALTVLYRTILQQPFSTSQLKTEWNLTYLILTIWI